MSRLPEHTEIELEVAKSLFDEFQKSMNAEETVSRTGPYCNKFEDLDSRYARAWIRVAQKLVVRNPA